MEAVLLIAAALAALSYFWRQREQKAMRAFIYLSNIGDGESVDLANFGAARVSRSQASQIKADMQDFARFNFGDSQVAMISAAREAGFSE